MPKASPGTDANELLVLSVLRDGKQYGYAIAKRVATQSEGGLSLPPGVLYPLLAKLEKAGLVASEWDEVRSERPDPSREPDAPGRRRRWYRLTPRGRRRLEQRVAAHRAYLSVIESFIAGPASGEEAAQ